MRQERRAQRGPASRERLATRPHSTAPGNAAGLGFRKAGRAGEAASLKRTPTGARGDVGGGYYSRSPAARGKPRALPDPKGFRRGSAGPATSISPTWEGWTSQKSYGYYVKANGRPLLTRCSLLKGGAGAGNAPAPQPPGKSNAQNVEDLLKVGDRFISKASGIPTGVRYKYNERISI